MNKQRLILLIISSGLLLAILLSCSIGAVHIPLKDTCIVVLKKIGFDFSNEVSPQVEAILWNIRFPRVLASAVVGSLLALAGVALQGLFRNPLADTTIIGTSSGAALFASIAIVLSSATASSASYLGMSLLSVAAFTGALLASFLVFAVSKARGKVNVSSMLLTGIAIGAICTALTGLLIYVANESQLRTLTFWTLGSLGGITSTSLLILFIALLITYFVVRSLGKSMNALALGEQDAGYLGINIEKTKLLVVIVVSLAAGLSVAFCGVIGFVGLAVPHIVRLVAGSDHRFVIPASTLGGALLLVLADDIGRTIAAPAEVPIGIITALIGAPIFLLLIKTKKKLLA